FRCLTICIINVFFFSSRRRHTRSKRDWSSDVCSSDLLTSDGQDYLIIDTAGMRKRGKVYENIEKYSVLRALKAIDRSDVVLVLIDAETGIREQDKKIAGYAHDAGRAVIMVVNKWDTVKSSEKTMREYEVA